MTADLAGAQRAGRIGVPEGGCWHGRTALQVQLSMTVQDQSRGRVENAHRSAPSRHTRWFEMHKDGLAEVPP